MTLALPCTALRPRRHTLNFDESTFGNAGDVWLKGGERRFSRTPGAAAARSRRGGHGVDEQAPGATLARNEDRICRAPRQPYRGQWFPPEEIILDPQSSRSANGIDDTASSASRTSTRRDWSGPIGRRAMCRAASIQFSSRSR